MENIEIVEIESKKDWKEFFKFPGWLYKSNAFYVAPNLKSEELLFSVKNPRYNEFILKAFLAKKGDEVIGRIAILIDKKTGVSEDEQAKSGFTASFTRFDFIDSAEVSELLMNAVLTLAKRTGVAALNGPVGFGEADTRGILISGFDRGQKRSVNKNAVDGNNLSYNYAYYSGHIEKLGFVKKEDFDCKEECGCGKVWRIYTKQLVSE